MHLGAGLVAELIVAIMSATSIAILFEADEAEILGWIDRDVRTVQVPVNAAPLALSLHAKANAAASNLCSDATESLESIHA